MVQLAIFHILAVYICLVKAWVRKNLVWKTARVLNLIFIMIVLYIFYRLFLFGWLGCVCLALSKRENLFLSMILIIKLRKLKKKEVAANAIAREGAYFNVFYCGIYLHLVLLLDCFSCAFSWFKANIILNLQKIWLGLIFSFLKLSMAC